MASHAAPIPRRAGHRLGLALVTAIITLCAFAPASVLASQVGAPSIESVGSAAGAEITIDARINPEGLETSYEIGLECSPCGPGDQWIEGMLSAAHESHEVVLALTGLQAGRQYWFAVRALNADGETSRRGETIEIPQPPESFPEGTGGSGLVTGNPPNEATLNELRAIGIREEERRTKEREEQNARGLAARPASELEHTEEQPSPGPTRTELPSCLVPALKGDTLIAARRVLARAHCGLGAIHRPVHSHGTLYVSAQSAPAGKRLVYRARVALRVGPKGNGGKRASHRA
jgi:hypothetical protein